MRKFLSLKIRPHGSRPGCVRWRYGLSCMPPPRGHNCTWGWVPIQAPGVAGRLQALRAGTLRSRST